MKKMTTLTKKQGAQRPKNIQKKIQTHAYLIQTNLY